MGDQPTQPRRMLDALWRRPAALAAGFLIAGILLHRVLPPRPGVWLGIAGALALAGAVTVRRAVVSCALLALALASLGAGLAQVEAFFYPADHICHFAADDPRLAQLELLVDQPPRTLHSAALPPRQVAAGEVQRVLTASGWRPASGQVLVRIDRPDERLQLGQAVRVLGMLARPAPAMNPAQFDWAAYYRDRRTLATVSIERAEDVELLARPGPQPLGRLRQWVRSVLARGFTRENSLDHALLRALLLGDSDPQLRDVQDEFIRTGTSHHLAISGMHVAIMGGFVYLVCRLLRRPPRMSAWIMMAFVVLYGVVALPSPPVVRSLLLCISFGLGVVMGRSTDGVHLLSSSVLLMLIYEPLDLYNAGFQLSFGTVLGLMLLAGPLVRSIRGVRSLDQQIAESVRPVRGWRVITRWCRRAMLEAVAAGCVAWVVAAPLIARHFEQLNPWAIVASIAMAPVVLAGLIGGLLKIILTVLLPPLASTWAMLAAGPMAAMRHMADFFARFPGSDVPLASPPLWLLLVYYALVCLPLLPVVRPRLRWGLRCGPAAAVLLALGLPLLVGLRAPAPAGQELRVTLLSVGAGQCAVVQTPAGKVVLIDAGAALGNDIARNCIRPYLRHIGRSSIDAVFLSHPNTDHFSAVADLAEHYRIGAVYISSTFEAESQGNHPAEAMLAALRERKCPLRTLSAGERLPLDESTMLEAIWPPPYRSFKANDDSLVLRLTCRGRAILFTGDIQETALRELAASPPAVSTDVMVAPHHGSAEASTARFVAAANPQTIVSSNDHTPSGKQRQFERLIADRAAYHTDRCGAITVTVGVDGAMRVETFRAVQ